MRQRDPSALAVPVTAVVMAAWLALACSLSRGGGATAPPTVGPSTAPMGSATAPVSMAASAVPPTAQPSVASSAASPAATTMLATSPAEPPSGVLTADGGAVTGHLGTYCWARLCSDEFELPAKQGLPALAASAGEALAFTLSPPIGFSEWSASYSSAKMADLTSLGGGGAPTDPDSTASAPPTMTAVTFDGPPAGEWALVVNVHFADASALVERGDATYVWSITVK